MRFLKREEEVKISKSVKNERGEDENSASRSLIPQDFDSQRSSLLRKKAEQRSGNQNAEDSDSVSISVNSDSMRMSSNRNGPNEQ